MPLTAMRAGFERLKRSRRVKPSAHLRDVASVAADAIGVLQAHAERTPLDWRGGGGKKYDVFVMPNDPRRFSRPVNRELFIADVHEFRGRWKDMADAADSARGAFALPYHPELVRRLYYTSTIAFAAATDLFQPGDKGGPGTFFEIGIGPMVALLTGRTETSAVTIPVPGTGGTETIPTDLSYAPHEGGGNALVIAVKISTRERISQGYVHQLILSKAAPEGATYRSVYAICSETNVMAPPKTPPAQRTHDVCWAEDTLVPKTIALYQNYVAQLDGLYYLDPPASYLAGIDGLPPVKPFGELLTSDVEALL